MAKRFGITKRFGARYGTTIKLRLGTVEVEQRKKHKCPYCGVPKIKRLSLGIWQCGKCQAKFSNKAYTVRSMKREDIKAKGA
jgi:large subunit ribosomal protein L37Ae